MTLRKVQRALVHDARVVAFIEKQMKVHEEGATASILLWIWIETTTERNSTDIDSWRRPCQKAIFSKLCSLNKMLNIC